MGDIARHFLMPALVVSIVGTLWVVAWAQELSQEARRVGMPEAQPIAIRRIAATPGSSESFATIDDR